MKQKNGGSQVITKPPGGLSKKHWLRYLFIYLVYAGAVLAVSAKFGLFTGSKVPANANIHAQDSSFSGVIKPVGQPVPLPNGILAFDEEMKQTTVHEGEKEAHFVFKLSNASPKTLIIEKVETSCGCTVAQLPQTPWMLKPHENGDIRVIMNVLGLTGKSARDVSVFTSQGYKVLKVEASILPAEKEQKVVAH